MSTSDVAVCCSSELGEIVRALAQFVEQPRVLDGDDGLGGEVLHQRNLLVGKRPDLLAVDGYCADQLVLLEHWHPEPSPSAGGIHKWCKYRIAVEITLFRPDVGNMKDLLGSADAGQRSIRMNVAYAYACPPLPHRCIGGLRSVPRTGTKNIAIAKEQNAELSLADARCILQYRLENCL